ncbi:TonB-dependent receptor [Olivibacter sp. SDN3]|uniref:outer membrane beta-barrel protein n=1 Tax=Olivibacter sp. SDN3 TaxID=2764720 RepID=UPI001650FFD6|nr:outer membrane beta-barrel protein [Olivibacter sp. SDN3]QNL50656.1 TonB-dependent receptor [Olivibacter sp. SDN3]
MKTLLLNLLALFFSTLVLGQTFSVKGRLTDSSKSPLAYASVNIKPAAQSQQFYGVYSDEDGNFEVTNIPTGDYMLQVSMLGMKTLEQSLKIHDNLNLETIMLEEDPNVLNEVTVTAKKDRLTRKVDRLVMNVEDNAAYAGRSSLELFNTAPGVFVNNGNISINGMWGTRVMVNGRILNLSGDDLKNYLQNLRAEDIQSIEIIARPPAEYDAEGSGGMINIILKKQTQAGMNARFGHDYTLGLGKYPSYRPNAGLSYKKDKLGMSLDYGYAHDKGFQEVGQERAFPNQGQYQATNDAVHRRRNNRIRFSTTYDINDQQFIALDYTGNYGWFTDSIRSVTDIVYPDAANNTQAVGDFPTHARNNFTNVGLNYSWNTDTLGSRLRFIADYTYSDKNAYSGTNSITYNAAGLPIADTIFTFFYPSTSKILTADLKYNKTFRSGLDLAIGGKLSSTDIDNANSYDIFLGETVREGANAFDYLYRERISAGFITLSGNLLQTQFSVGLRGEHSNIRGELIGDGQDTLTKWNYFSLFPSAFLQRPLDEAGNHSLTLSANRRIKRPSYQDLNPYRYYLDNYSVQAGNPFLTPQFSNSVELGYLFKQKYYAAFSYARSRDVINQVIETDLESEQMTLLRKNTGREDVYTATFSAPVNLTSWWTTTNNLILTHSRSRAPEFDVSLNSLVLQSEQEINLPQDWKVSLNAFYTPGVLIGNISTTSIASVDVGIQKKFFGERLSARAALSDIFYTNNFSARSFYNDSVLDLWQRDQTRVFTLSLMYNINIGKAFKLRSLDKSNTEERERL